jgi:gamma-glutamyl phosphate reductase
MRPAPTKDSNIVRTRLLRVSLGIERELATLTTADKNRVLLALHAQIGDQLDALAANNNQ